MPGAPGLGVQHHRDGLFPDRRRGRHRRGRCLRDGQRPAPAPRAAPARPAPCRHAARSRRYAPVARSIAPTISRSRVGTSWIAVSGRPAAASPSTRQAWIAVARLRSFPSRRAGSPRCPPSGTAHRHRRSRSGGFRRSRRSRPAACARGGCAGPMAVSHSATTAPTGSFCSATARKPSTIAAHPALVQPQAVQHRRAQALRLTEHLDPAALASRISCAPRPDGIGGRDQGRGLAFGTGTGQALRRHARRAPDAVHLVRSRSRPSAHPFRAQRPKA